MTHFPRHARFPGPIVMIGFGSIGRGTLPLMLRHLEFDPKRLTIIDPDDSHRDKAEACGARFHAEALTPETLDAVLRPLLRPADAEASGPGLIVNLSVDVSSVALIQLARELGALYIDTCIEPWPGGYTDPSKTPSERSNYALRETARALIRPRAKDPTAVIAHGANPGLVSHLVKRALLNLARDLSPTGQALETPKTREGWAQLAASLSVKGIHIAERDTQTMAVPKPHGVFVNTWSIEGFLSEGLQPAELGWGTHEPALPPDGREHAFGPGAAIYLLRPGAGMRVRSWTPLEGPYQGYLITHNEAISIADYLTHRDGAGRVLYRPTCHYAYHPCDAAILSLHELQGKAFIPQSERLLINEEITAGRDELGVLLYGHGRNAYWYGSQLSIEEARALAPDQNATGLQVTAAVLGGIVWAIENPEAGVVDADELDFERVLAVAEPYLGRMHGEYTDWTPLEGRDYPFEEPDLERGEPWAFANVRVR